MLRIRSTRHGPLIDSLWWHAEDRLPPSDAPPTHRAARASRDRRAGRRWVDVDARAGPGRGRGGGSYGARRPPRAGARLRLRGRGRQGRRAGRGWLPSRLLPTGSCPSRDGCAASTGASPWRSRRCPGSRSPRRGVTGRWRRPALAGARRIDQTEWLWRPGDRATRLEQVLQERLAEGRLDLVGAAGLLAESQAPRASRVVTAIVGLARLGGDLRIEAEEIAGLLERWDGRLAADSAGAAAYHLVIEHLLERLLAAPLGEALRALPRRTARASPERGRAAGAARREAPAAGGWTDEAEVMAAARASLRDAWVSLNHRLGPTRSAGAGASSTARRFGGSARWARSWGG